MATSEILRPCRGCKHVNRLDAEAYASRRFIFCEKCKVMLVTPTLRAIEEGRVEEPRRQMRRRRKAWV